MKIATSHSTAEDVREACTQAYAELRRQLGSEPAILYVAWSVGYDGHALLGCLRELASDIRVHAASTCLGSLTEAGFIATDGRGLSLFGIHDPAGAYGVAAVGISGSAREAAQAAVQAALDDAERPGEIPAMVRLSATPGDEESVIAGIEDVLGPDVPIIGGSAADNTVQGNWLLGTGSGLHADAVVVSVLFPGVTVSYAFHSGYNPTDTVGTVTRAAGRVLYEIDGVPAARVYNDWTGGAIADALAAGGNVLAGTTLFPLGRVVGELGGVPYYRLSHPDSVTPDGALTLFSEIAEGDRLTLMHGSVDSLVTRAGRVADAALAAANLSADEVSGAMVVYCAGCMLTVQDELERVVDGLREVLGAAPFQGTFTFGEQGCFVGGENRHGNLMISVVVFGT